MNRDTPGMQKAAHKGTTKATPSTALQELFAKSCRDLMRVYICIFLRTVYAYKWALVCMWVQVRVYIALILFLLKFSLDAQARKKQADDIDAGFKMRNDTR